MTSSELGAHAGDSPRPSPGRAAQNAGQSAERQRRARSKPRSELLPPPAVHPDLAALATLAVTDEDRAA